MIRLLHILLPPPSVRGYALCVVKGTLPRLLSSNSSLPWQPWLISTDARTAEGPVCDVVAKVSLLECVGYRMFSIEYVRRERCVLAIECVLYRICATWWPTSWCSVPDLYHL
jgi:hypothetical protein